MSDTYRSAGVDYSILDAAKRQALATALATSPLLQTHGGHALDASRGEPAFVFELLGRHFAFVLECLGTKSIIARRYLQETGQDRFSDIGYDTVAAIVNDLICPGALPLVVNAYFATGSESFFGDARLASLVEGWKQACVDAGATWGGGESPTLAGLVATDEVELAGSAIGVVPEGCEPLLGEKLRAGDEIALVASSGLHANGASLIRMLADRASDGLQTVLPSGRSLGDAALVPAHIYVSLIAAVQKADIPITYATHITGHGLRKLMRAAGELTYRIDSLPEVPEIFSFVARELSMDVRDSYGTFNMGAGFAIYCERGAAQLVVDAANEVGLEGLVAGRVEKGPRRVVLEPLDIVFDAADLELR